MRSRKNFEGVVVVVVALASSRAEEHQELVQKHLMTTTDWEMSPKDRKNYEEKKNT